MSNHLLPCPFCGGPAEVERVGTGRQSCIVRCQECGTSLESNESGAGSTWNTRETPVPLSQWPQRADIDPSPAIALDVGASNDGVPIGYHRVKSAQVYRNGTSLVLLAEPDDIWPGYDDAEEHPHNCDMNGCLTHHVIGIYTVAPADPGNDVTTTDSEAPCPAKNTH